MNFEQWRQSAVAGEVRFFSLGRHALAAGLRLYGIGEGDKVLLPEFICRDLLAALSAVGAQPVWYPVGSDLRPSTAPSEWPAARALVVVNYFGFPQPLQFFRAYAAKHGAVLIEDNAHGFLSRDENGGWLGTRGDVGIFSLRKTLLVPDGAMMVTGGEAGRGLPPQLAEAGQGFSPAVATKAAIRAVPMIGTASQMLLTDVIRALRRMRGATASASCSDASETDMPSVVAPYVGLARQLARLDVGKEIARRRDLYRDAERAARAAGVVPLFPALPDLVTPYGFVFRRPDERAFGRMKAWARSKALDLIVWPELPGAIERDAPDRYRDICVVNFL